MLKTREGRTRILNYVCAGFSFILLVMQFLPFWKYGEKSVSINGFVWWDPQNYDIVQWFTEKLNPEFFDIYYIVIPAVLVLVLCVLSIVMCIINSRKGLPALITAAAGITMIIACTCLTEFRLGSFWVAHLAVSVVLLLVAIATVVNSLIKEK